MLRVVEIAEDDRHLARDRGFLVVSQGGRELGRVPLADIAVVLANAHGITFTANLVLGLAEVGAALVLCAANHTPAAVVWPLDGHFQQTARIRAQLAAPRPLAKRLWQSLVRAKIQAQADTLTACQADGAGALTDLARAVKSGDPDNLEAQAARRYWQNLFGSDFRRDPGQPGINGLLNYGYAILRGGVARAVACSGLHPSLGLYHSNGNNPFVLVDDVMEPFRPLADFAVWSLVQQGQDSVTPITKRHLAGLLTWDLDGPDGVTPAATAMQTLVTSLAQIYLGEKSALVLPGRPRPLFTLPRPDPQPES